MIVQTYFQTKIMGHVTNAEIFSWLLIALLPLLLITIFHWIIFIWFIFCLWFILKQFGPKNWIEGKGKYVYITGCDSGFGKCAALQLAERGFTVFAGCLKPGQCIELKNHPNVRILDLDVTDEAKIQACADIIEQECADEGLWALCNNAGYATAGEVEWISLEVYKQQLDVNLWGAVRVTKSVLPLVRKATGRVVTVTTGISRYAAPGRSAYCMSKAALEAFTDSLRHEMYKFGVKVITIQPGNFTSSTNVFDGVAAQLRQAYISMTPGIKAVYGENYLQHFFNQICGKYVSSSNGSEIQPVVDTYVHAIASEYPRIRYKPMQMNWIVWLFFYYLLPEEITDSYLKYFS